VLGLYATLGVNKWSGSRPYGTLENLYLLEHPAYTTIASSIGYTWRRGRIDWNAEVALRNVTDKFLLYGHVDSR
jgi:hypothetical protein